MTMNAMTLFNRFWTEDDGALISSEVVLIGSMLVVGVVTGATAIRDTVVTEMSDFAAAIGSLNQSYCFGGIRGHCAWTAGSSFNDRLNVAAVAPQPVVCSEAFGLPPCAPPPCAPPPCAPPPCAPPPTPACAPTCVPMCVPCIPVVPCCVLGAPNLSPCQYPVSFNQPCSKVVMDGCNCNSAPTVMQYGTPATAAVQFQQPLMQVGIAQRGGYVDSGCVYNMPQGQRPENIDLRFTQVGDNELRNLKGFAGLKGLHILGSNVTDAGLVYLKGLSSLESLTILGTQVTDAGLPSLAALSQLRELHLVSTKITDAGLDKLKGMSQLQWLDLRGTQVTEAGVDRLNEALPNLRITR
jgi:hypothetical protein